MDFAALMSKELSRSKRPHQGDTKYARRSEAEEQRQEAYLADQNRITADRDAKAAAKRKHDEEAAAENTAREKKRRRLADDSRKRREDQAWEDEQLRRKRLGLPELVRENSNDADAGLLDGLEDIKEDNLVAKLRMIGQPTCLFGEGHASRVRRYIKLTTVVTDGVIPTTLKLVEDKDMKVQGDVPKDKEGRQWLFRQLISYFSMVLTVYEKKMEEEKTETAASKNAYSTMVQTRENMRPVSSSLHHLGIQLRRKSAYKYSSSFESLKRAKLKTRF